MKKRFTAVCTTESLSEIRAFSTAELNRLGITEEVTAELVLAIDEACANCIIHQHKCDGVSEFEISIQKKNGFLVIELRDEGEAFPLNAYRPQDLKDIVEEGKKGGLGISLITRIMDKVEVIQEGNISVYRFTRFVNGGNKGSTA